MSSGSPSGRSTRPRRFEDERELRRTSVRIGLQTGGLLLAVLAIVSALVLLVVIGTQQTQIRSVLDQAIAVTHGDGGHRPDDDDAEVRDVVVAVSDPYGLRTDASMPTGLPDRAVMAQVSRTGVTDERRLTLNGVHYVVRTAKHGDDTIQAVLDLREQQEEVTRLLQALLISGGIGVVLVAGVAALLSRRAVRPIAEALTLQRRFVADAAHELRTPLTLLSTRAQLLGRRLERDQPSIELMTRVRGDVGGLVADSANLTEILEDLLLAADRSTELPQDPVDLSAVVTEAVRAAQPAATQRGIAIQTVPAGAPTVIGSGSRPALLRAAHALIDNAVSHAHTRTEVGVSADSRSVRLRVADDGDGIDNQMAARIFERFASQRSESGGGPGSDGGRRHYGLGLALVAEIAARHGGTVSAGARPDGGHGAVFELTLPRSVMK